MCQDVWTARISCGRQQLNVYAHSYSVEGQSFVSLVVFVQSDSYCRWTIGPSVHGSTAAALAERQRMRTFFSVELASKIGYRTTILAASG
jgi:hypothetical protein